MAPSDLRFTTGSFGKPRLAGDLAPDLEFNLSHSGSFGLVGWAPRRRLGVDVEVWNDTTDLDDLAPQCFSAAELRQYRALRQHQRTRGFFQCWARKEAVIKADGRGLSLGLRTFDVDVWNPGDSILLRSPADAVPLRLVSLDLPDGLSGAVAVECDSVNNFVIESLHSP